MGLLEGLASAFINTFGITQPTGRTRRQAAWFIFGMLLLVLVALSGAGYALYHLMRSAPVAK